MADAPIVQEPFYLPVEGGERFCIRRAPAVGPPRGIVVHVPAFAEEMNKSRRMTAWCARKLASLGYEVIHVDLLGCGDSPGDFGDATWAAWVSDVTRAVEWAVARCDAPLWLWGLRAGALLASAALPSLPRQASLLLWQPVLSGRTHLTQFLRVAAAPAVPESGGAGTRELLAAFAGGRAVEVGGYRIAPALASGLAAAEFALPAAFRGRVVWVEVTGAGSASPAPKSRACIDEMRGKDIDAAIIVVSGPMFWQTVETEDCPAAVEETLAALEADHDSRLRRAAAVL